MDSKIANAEMHFTPETKFPPRHFLWSDNAILIYLALAKLVIHLLTSTGYGYFGDELYWLAMTKHLDFGYVDVPPLVAYLGAFSRVLIGDSLFAVHILPAIVGAVMVYFAGLLAREMGGGRFAQWFTALLVLVAPIWLVLNSWFTYDPFDQLCSIILLYLIILIIKQETPKRWLCLGIVAGLGVMTKLSMFFLIGALVVAFLISSRRKIFLAVWPWFAALIGVMICTPYLIWQSVHDWPLLKYLHAYPLIRPHPETPQFLIQLILSLNPLLLLVWLPGLFYLLFHREGKKYRILGFAFLILLVFLTGFNKLPFRLLISSCFPLFAGGAIWLERIVDSSVKKRGIIPWTKRVYISLVLIFTTLIIPLNLPVLPITALKKYLSATPAFINENLGDVRGIIPFHFAFRIGWPEMVREIAAVYHGLPENDRAKLVIWANYYWEAGAIDLLGKEYGLPDVICNHLSYQNWRPGLSDPEVAIVLGTTNFHPSLVFDEVTPITVLKDKQSSLYFLGKPLVYVCRKPKSNFRKFWERYKTYQ